MTVVDNPRATGVRIGCPLMGFDGSGCAMYFEEHELREVRPYVCLDDEGMTLQP